MNEKIKELAIQAKIQMVSEPRLEEFSELIINDVIEYLHRIGCIGILVERSIKKNYGMKE
jgi:hypothetical protein